MHINVYTSPCCNDLCSITISNEQTYMQPCILFILALHLDYITTCVRSQFTKAGFVPQIRIKLQFRKALIKWPVLETSFPFVDIIAQRTVSWAAGFSPACFLRRSAERKFHILQKKLHPPKYKIQKIFWAQTLSLSFLISKKNVHFKQFGQSKKQGVHAWLTPRCLQDIFNASEKS